MILFRVTLASDFASSLSPPRGSGVFLQTPNTKGETLTNTAKNERTVFHCLAVAQANITSDPRQASRDHDTLIIAPASACICNESVRNVSMSGSHHIK